MKRKSEIDIQQEFLLSLQSSSQDNLDSIKNQIENLKSINEEIKRKMK